MMKNHCTQRWWIKALAILGMLLCMTGSFAEETVSLDGVSFEVKFLLDAEQTLTGERLPTEALTEQFALEDLRPIDVIYLETSDRAFINDGWVNRIRWKNWKKKPECTFKKRYSVDGADASAVLSALDRVREDGLDISAEDCSLEIDWGYAKMTLSATWEASEKYRDYQTLYQFTTGDAIAFAASLMPAQEMNWKSDGWGWKTLSRAQKIGPLQLLRAKGIWDETELTLDIISVTRDSAPVVEMSFKTDDYQTAKETRERLTAHLEALGILRREDSLKTQTILDAHLLKAPEAPDLTLPASARRIEEDAFNGCAFRHVWIGEEMTEIQGNAFADCEKLRYVRLPGHAVEVADNAFPDDAELVIIGQSGGGADTYANAHGYGFIPEP